METRCVDHRDPPAITAKEFDRQRSRILTSAKRALRPGGNLPRRVRDVETNERWRSARECGNALDMHWSSIYYCLKHKTRTRSGRLLQYVDA